MDTNKKIAVIITSVIKCSNKSVSYSKTRSVFAKEDRLKQTMDTIGSVRKYIPDAYIILLELGQQYEENIKIQKIVDQYIDFSNNNLIRFFVDGIFKGLGEAVGVIVGYMKINKSFDYYFKLSGRYILNNNFNIANFISKEPFSAKIYDKKVMSTRLYFFKKEYLRYWFLKHIISIPFLLLNRSIERLLYIFINSKNINSVKTLGVTGYIGPNGQLIEE